MGVEALYETHDLFLSQEKYIQDLLEKINMQQAQPISYLMSITKDLSQFKEDPFRDTTLYLSVVRSLLHMLRSLICY